MFDLKQHPKYKKRRPRSYLSHWPLMIRVVLGLGLVLWILFIFRARLEAPPPPPAPPPDTVTFSEPDGMP